MNKAGESRLTRRGAAELKCEIFAKPTGQAGFLRVWVSPDKPNDPQLALAAFLDVEPLLVDRQYRKATVGSLPAAEVSYLRRTPPSKETQRERALAVVTPQGTVVLTLGGVDLQQYERMLPAYLLAKQSMRRSS